jgi:hypothetical protein
MLPLKSQIFSASTFVPMLTSMWKRHEFRQTDGTVMDVHIGDERVWYDLNGDRDTEARWLWVRPSFSSSHGFELI